MLLCTSVPAAAFAAEEEYFWEDCVLAMEEEKLGEAWPDLPELTMEGVSEKDGENPWERKM